MGTVPTKPVECIEWNVASISNVTVQFSTITGTDSATVRYLNLGADATSVQLRTDQVLSIDMINGQTLKDPITINANKSFILSRRARFRIGSLRLNVLTDSTNIKILAFTTGRSGL